MKTNNLFKKIDVKYAFGGILFMGLLLCMVNSCSDDKERQHEVNARLHVIAATRNG